MPVFLIDENLSPRIAVWLREKRYVAHAVREVGLKGKSDEEIIAWIRKEGRVLITADLDFGEFFVRRSLGNFAVIILRPRPGTFDAARRLLDRLHRDHILRDEKLNQSLLLVASRHIRWRRFIAEDGT